MSYVNHRIELGQQGKDTRVYEIVDGKERDISSQLSGLELSSHVGDINQMDLTFKYPAAGGIVNARTRSRLSGSARMLVDAYEEARQ